MKPDYLKQQGKSSTCLLLLCVLISPHGYASHQPTISQLRHIIQLQQQELQQQSQAINQQRHLLQKLSQRVDQLTHQSISAKAKHSKSHISVNKVTEPQNFAVSEAPRVTNLPEHQFLIGSKRSQLSISGQLNAIGLQVDDGNYNRTYFGTNSAARNQLNINSRHDFSPTTVIGSHLQLGFRTNPSSSINQISPNSSAINIRRAEIYLKMKHWGTIYLGQGETASDNTDYADLSATMVVARATVNDIGGGFYFNGLSTNPAVGDVFNGLDGLSRKVRARYDSPQLYGFSAATSISAGNSDNKAPHSDVALRFDKAFAKTRIEAAVAYTTPVDISSGINLAHGNQINGSASILLPFGVSMTGSGGAVFATDSGRKDPHFFYIKPGYQFRYFGIGTTALSMDFGKYYNFAANNDVGTTLGAQLMQNINKLDLAIYSGYRQFKLKRPSNSFNNINIFLLGAFYKF